MSVQCGGVAEQKLTWPGVTGLPPAVTIAVRVTTVPCLIAVAGAPEAVTARVVFVCARAFEPSAIHASRMIERRVGWLRRSMNHQPCRDGFERWVELYHLGGLGGEGLSDREQRERQTQIRFGDDKQGGITKEGVMQLNICIFLQFTVV